ncbi:MAG: DUF3149 domain-containing protein [Eikenella sp.]|nr:DUF3149 domain-containing protein [Eikenella sp.]
MPKGVGFLPELTGKNGQILACLRRKLWRLPECGGQLVQFAHSLISVKVVFAGLVIIAPDKNFDVKEYAEHKPMQVFSELFSSSVGIASFITIAAIVVIAVFLFFWVKRRVDEDSKNNQR